jgi:RNA polymerase sigma factor (sigma-70 family)
MSTEERAAHALLHSLAQGNSRAFWELWGLYKPHLYQICLSHMVGVREDAEDALSRSMLRALDKLPRTGPQIENVRAWLSRLTVNLCADMHRERRRRARHLEPIDVIPFADSRPVGDDSPEDAFLNREAYVCMRHAVNDLPARLREPFALRFFHEMAYGDIAARLMLSNDNVRKRIQQARDILKQRLRLSTLADSARSQNALGERLVWGDTRDGAGRGGDARWLVKDTKAVRSGTVLTEVLHTGAQRPRRTTIR